MEESESGKQMLMGQNSIPNSEKFPNIFGWSWFKLFYICKFLSATSNTFKECFWFWDNSANCLIFPNFLIVVLFGASCVEPSPSQYTVQINLRTVCSYQGF